MKRRLQQELPPKEVILVGPDGSQHAVKQRWCSGRDFAVEPVSDVEGVVRVQALGENPLAVELKRDDGEWMSVQVVDSGEDALVAPGTRFYVLSRQAETTFEVRRPKSPASSVARREGSPSRKRRSESIQSFKKHEQVYGNMKCVFSGQAVDPDKSELPAVPVDAPFSLMWVRGLGEDSKYNTGPLGVQLKDLVAGGVLTAFISNYMIDFPWLLSACPELRTVRNMIVVHGERGSRPLEIINTVAGLGLKTAMVHGPQTLPFGTHHSKAFVLGYERGVRVIVHTANLIYVDCNNKSQGIWWQDFPKKETNREPSDFEAQLLAYLDGLKLPREGFELMRNLVKNHDFSGARAKLVTSIPGYHQGSDLNKYGHMRVRMILQDETFDSKFDDAPIVCQSSSLGSIDRKWLESEFGASLAKGVASSGTRLRPPPTGSEGIKFVWPRVTEVRNSIEGWSAGYSIPGPSKNVLKPFLRPFYNKFGGKRVGRQRAMPHIKTYARYKESDLAWVLLTSHNLSKAAWGTLQKKGTQLMIRSYEMGVIFVPSTEHAFQNSEHCGFSCTNNQNTHISPQEQVRNSTAGASDSHSDNPCLRGFKCFGDPSADGHVVFPLPYQIPPEVYDEEDVPWTVDSAHKGLDSLGLLWDAPVSH